MTRRNQRGNKWTTHGAGGASNKNSHGEESSYSLQLAGS
jgi:hypothetical protein